MSDEIRDVGPYQNADQVIRQFGNWSRGIPAELCVNRMLVREALLVAGVEPSDFEMDYLAENDIDPILATILHGWVLRAFMSGMEAPVSSPSAPR